MKNETHIISRKNVTSTNNNRPIQHIITQQSNIEDTYEQIIEQPHTTSFRSQNNHLFSPRWAPKMDHSIAQFPTQPTFKATSLSSNFLLFPCQSPHDNTSSSMD